MRRVAKRRTARPKMVRTGRATNAENSEYRNQLPENATGLDVCIPSITSFPEGISERAEIALPEGHLGGFATSPTDQSNSVLAGGLVEDGLA